MNDNTLYTRILKQLEHTSIEIPTVPTDTRKPLWFKVYGDKDIIFVNGSTEHFPSSRISAPRMIFRGNFELVHSYYKRWEEGEAGAKQEANKKSMNTAYIYGLIERFK